MTPIAPLRKRFAGFLADVVVLGVASLALIPLTGGIDLDALAAGEGLPPRFLLAAAALTGAYQVGFIAWRGQTPGKMLLRIRVVGEDTNEIPSPFAAFVRWLVPAAAGSLPDLLSLAWLVVYGWIVFDDRNQGLHDKAARTLVIDLDEV